MCYRLCLILLYNIDNLRDELTNCTKFIKKGSFVNLEILRSQEKVISVF